MTNSIALLATQSSEMTMTLKEITDMLNVRHDNAMRTVALMAESPDFGELLKLRSSTSKLKPVWQLATTAHGFRSAMQTHISHGWIDVTPLHSKSH